MTLDLEESLPFIKSKRASLKTEREWTDPAFWPETLSEEERQKKQNANDLVLEAAQREFNSWTTTWMPFSSISNIIPLPWNYVYALGRDDIGMLLD